MSKNLVRKIIATVFFILSLFLIWQLFTVNPEYQNNTEMTIRFGALFLSNLFLFVLTYTFQTEKIIEKEKGIVLQKEKHFDDIEEEKTGDTELKINRIISNVKNVSSDKNFFEELLKIFSKEFYIVQGLIYVKGKDKFKMTASYAIYGNKKINEFSEGQGIPGQVAKDMKIKIITDIPEDYINVVSGLGACSPQNLLFIPIVSGNETIALIEATAFDKFPENLELYYNELNSALVKKIKNLKNDE